jgi:Asp-tRNA(Asn)/Glu-tRNA(Gln) amidotransferase A subunit family amidase
VTGAAAQRDPALLTIEQARHELRERRLSAVELTEAVLARVERLNPELRAYIAVDRDAALQQARAADGRTDHPALGGIPICVKDVIDVAGFQTTAGAARWRRTPDCDAPVVAALRAAGAIVIGKGNTNEFAYGIDGQNPHWGNCLNPLDRGRLSGGSSSGPAVATASGMALAGIGTDTSGSIRAPASLCGLVGIRPTPGLVSLRGVVPLAWSYDTVGPLARSVADAEIVLAAMSADRACAPSDPVQLSGLRVGVLDALLEASEHYVADGVLAAAKHFEGLGAVVSSVDLSLLQYANAVHQIIQHAEAAAIHRPWFEAQRAHYADPVRVRLQAGELLPAVAYLTAQRARRLLIAQAQERMRDVDLLLAPSTPFIAPLQGVSQVTIRGVRHELRPALLACVLGPTELACPIVAVPAGVHEGLPFGMQLIGRPRSERLLLGVAAAWEKHLALELQRSSPG